MSTPTATSLKKSLPSGTSNNPSTPANAGSGTTPRSTATPTAYPSGFLSPATSRTTLGKSPKPPVNTPSTQGKGFSAASAANTPQIHSGHANKTVIQSSLGLSHGSPGPLVSTPTFSAGMTAGIGSPGIHESLGMALSMSTMGVAMGLSSSTLGVNLGTGSSIGPGRMGEDERRRRLEAVLQVIGQRTGMVSQHGLEQLGRRLGLNLAWDSFSTTRIGHGRLLTLAGSQDSFAVDVEFCERPNETDNVVRVTLTYHGLNDAVNEGTGQAGRIMHRNLTTRKDDQGITPALDRFAINLEKLSRMDKLSTAGVSCFEAINGVYTSLKKLHDHETKAAATLLEDRATDQRVEMEVLCKGSGSPKLHARGRLGMQLDYWRSQYLALSRVQTARIPEDCTPMDLDTDTNQTMNNDLFEDDGLTYSLIIECEYSPPHTYPTIRVSTDWISDRVKQSPDDIDSVLNDTNESSPPILHTDWQDPIAFGPAQEGEVHSQARFTAKFDPPICIPFRTAVQIYASVGVDISHELCNVAWHAHILDCLETPLPAAGSPFRTVAYRSLARPSEEPSDYEREVWRASLTIPRAESARVIDSLPFSHPKQLVAVLPILRQYIFLGSLLKKIFPSKPTLSLAAKSERRPNTVHFSQEEHSKRPISGSALNDDIDIFMAASDDEADGKSTTAPQRDQLDAQPPIKSLDIMLRMDGLVGPRLAIAVPPGGFGNHMIYLDIDVLPGGEVNIRTDQVKASGQLVSHTAALAKGLMIAEDLGIWAAWARQKFW